MTIRKYFITVFFILFSFYLTAQNDKDIKLPAPQTGSGVPLMKALKERKSTRSFSSEKLSRQTISNLLWAADGINRPESEKRTAPSAMNMQEVQIYAAMPDGLYKYDAKEHKLLFVLADDIREKAGMQGFVKDAPLVLIYVANYDLFSTMTLTKRMKAFYTGADVGFIGQNVYLYCASEGLATVTLGLINKKVLAKSMKLKKAGKILLSQPVGKPAKEQE